MLFKFSLIFCLDLTKTKWFERKEKYFKLININYLIELTKSFSFRVEQ